MWGKNNAEKSENMKNMKCLVHEDPDFMACDIILI